MAHGGRRPGAGAKPHAYSEETQKKLMVAMERAAKEEGCSWEDILADIVIKRKFKEENVGIREFLAASNLVANIIVVKSSYKQIDQHLYDHRVIVLPEIKRPKDDEVAKA